MRRSKSNIPKWTSLVAAAIFVFAVSGVGQRNSDKGARRMVLVGDSTVNNTGEDFSGWGNVIAEFFDAGKLTVVNRARGGRSSRTFQTEGLWNQVARELRPGDIVLIQFGHNDGGPVDKDRARGSLRGIGNETQTVTIENTGKTETVRTYGWYMRKYVSDAKARKAAVVILSPVPRNIWKNGKVVRAANDYGLWARQVAESTGAVFVDLNEISAQHFEKIGPDIVGAEYFTARDHTHTSPAGARVNAELVIEGLLNVKKLKIRKYLVRS